MKSNRLKPVKVRIVKCYSTETGQLYGPIQNLLKDLKLDVESVKKQYEENGNEIIANKKPRYFIT